MDPVTIVGTASAVADIIGLISKTITSLRALHAKWRDADFTILNLITQLTALRAALDKISEWISSDLAGNPKHHQLVIDLEDSITCCTMLTRAIDDKLSKLGWSEDSTLDLESRIRVVFEDKTSKDFQIFIERQTNALTLLLVACSCKTASEQKSLLEKRSTREAFQKIKDDSSSLFVLHDAASRFSGWSNSTGNSSKMSRVFPFDAQLMGSKVYQRAIRSLFRRNVRAKVGDMESIKLMSKTRPIEGESEQMVPKSDNFDLLLEEDAKGLRKEVNIVLLGSFDSGKDSIINNLSLYSLYDTVRRTTEPGYMPTMSDILHLRPKHKGIKEVEFFMGGLMIRIFDLKNELISSFKQFGDAEAIIYVANIASYDVELEGMNQLVEILKHYKETTHDYRLTKPPIILLLNKAKEFEEKLARSPLSLIYPDYTGGTDPDLAAKHILELFVQLNLPGHQLRPYLVDLDHTSIQNLIYFAVLDSVFMECISKTPNLRKWQ